MIRRLSETRLSVKALDIVIFLAALLGIALISAQTYFGRRPAAEISISAAEGRWVYPLDSTETLLVPGPLGDTVVDIRDGAVRVQSSPCPEKICVKTGAVSKPGQWIACLPNRIFISIGGKGKDRPDAISQ